MRNDDFSTPAHKGYVQSVPPAVAWVAYLGVTALALLSVIVHPACRQII